MQGFINIVTTQPELSALLGLCIIAMQYCLYRFEKALREEFRK